MRKDETNEKGWNKWERMKQMRKDEINEKGWNKSESIKMRKCENV